MEKFLSPTSRRRGAESITAKTVIHVSYAVTIAAAFASSKNPATVKNLPKVNVTISNPILM
jgi:hypothetical protein